MAYTDEKIIGERVRKARVLANLTLKELSDATGIGYATISRIETGKRILNVIELIKIADKTNQSLMFFLGNENKVIEYFYPSNYRS